MSSLDILASLAIEHNFTAPECEVLLGWLDRFPAADRKVRAIGAVRAIALYTLANDVAVEAEEVGEDPEALVRFREQP